MAFPRDFVWGTATASYQIEGSTLADGRGECIWYRFSHTPGKVSNGDTGDVACDHYHRYQEDVALMRDIGLGGYRFSISWPRVIPAGTGSSNPEGLDFYDRLVDALLAKQITPFITLYHWDLPQALQDRGGWENRDSIAWFRDYTDLVTRRLGDRVKHWITFNEPWVVAFVGNLQGRHAPGKQDLTAALQVTHHLLLSHGEAVPVIRRNASGAQAGITLNLHPIHPGSDSDADQSAAQRYDGYANRWFLDPVFEGRYPDDMVEGWRPNLAGLDLAEVKSAAVPIDFLGVNYYTRNIVVAGDGFLGTQFQKNADAEHTEMGWEVYPEGLTELLVRLTKDYDPPALYITENGAAFADHLNGGDVVEDERRVAYLKSHFEAAGEAIRQGVPLKGYFVWSLMDNFEWAHGYSKRFGVIYIDYPTQRRIWKRSAWFYKDWIKTQSISS